MGCRKQAHAHTIIFTRNHQCSKNFEIKSGVNSIKCVRGDVIKRTFLKDTVPGKHTHTHNLQKHPNTDIGIAINTRIGITNIEI